MISSPYSIVHEASSELQSSQTFKESLLSILPPGIETGIADIPEYPLHTSELAPWTDYTAGFSPTRASEFVAGRKAAGDALTNLGCENTYVYPGEDKAPVWPEGAVGSISHTDRIAVAIVSWRNRFASIGIDIERCGALHPRDAHIVVHENDEPSEDPTLLMSIKESAFKCVYPCQRRHIDFLEAEVSVDWERQRFLVEPSTPWGLYFKPVQGCFARWRNLWQVVTVSGTPLYEAEVSASDCHAKKRQKQTKNSLGTEA